MGFAFYIRLQRSGLVIPSLLRDQFSTRAQSCPEAAYRTVGDQSAGRAPGGWRPSSRPISYKDLPLTAASLPTAASEPQRDRARDVIISKAEQLLRQVGGRHVPQF